MWRAGKDALIAAEGALFPDRCVICNGPTGWYRRPTRLEYMPPAAQLKLLLWLVVPSRFTLQHLAAVKRAELHWTLPLPLCLEHRHRAAQGMAVRLAGWSLLPISFAMLVAAKRLGFLCVLSLALAPLIAYSGYLWARVARVTRVEGEWLYLRVGRRFVESLPPVPTAGPAYRSPAEPAPAQSSAALPGWSS